MTQHDQINHVFISDPMSVQYFFDLIHHHIIRPTFLISTSAECKSRIPSDFVSQYMCKHLQRRLLLDCDEDARQEDAATKKIRWECTFAQRRRRRWSPFDITVHLSSPQKRTSHVHSLRWASSTFFRENYAYICVSSLNI